MIQPTDFQSNSPRPCILTIAGSDSGGGAGIQADIRTISALGAFGMSAITALTAQNGLGVTGIHAPEPDFIRLQLNTLLDGFPIKAAKTGMLFSAGIIEAVADTLNAAEQKFPLVVDPVSVSQSGHQLLEQSAVSALITHIFPLAALLTPNWPEAELLADMEIRTEADIAEAIRRMLGMGAQAVLLKGGHVEALTAEMPVDWKAPGSAMPGHVTDWLGLPGQVPVALPQPRIETPNNHGTGCTLSAAIATGLGQGMPLLDAVTRAQRYLNACLKASYAPGKGFGPPNHMAGCGL